MKTGIIGAGTMGSGIAQVFATAGHEVYVYDTHGQSLAKAAASLKETMQKLLAKEKITPELAASIESNHTWVSNMYELADCDVVIEAIVEVIDIKKSIFKQLSAIVKPGCILASNTSSLSITALAASCDHPGQFIGIHFFNPAPLMILTEIIPGLQTSTATTETIYELIKSVGKTPVIAKDTPGFIVNRIARPYYSEAIRIYEEGIAGFAAIDTVMTNTGGFRMGPFALMDLIGNDVNFAVTETIFRETYYEPRYKPSVTQKRLVEAGYLGKKSGRGYYDYNTEQYKPVPDNLLSEKICRRILAMLINEAAEAVLFNIASVEDIDFAMTKGVNYPKGLLQWADEKGIANIVYQLDELYETYHEERYRCSALLRRMADNNQHFYENKSGRLQTMIA